MAVQVDDGSPDRTARRYTAKRARRSKPDAEIVLICNPRAGGRWKQLARILDSPEARHVRRIVTDSVEDIAMTLDELGHDARLLCIYGGDGTIQRILDRLAPSQDKRIRIALIGGGTMNVSSRWCGFSSDPGRNFRYVVRAFHSGELLWRELPLLEVTAGSEFHRGFTFGMGPIVRLLDEYERGRKGKIAAASMATRAIAAAWLQWPRDVNRLLEQMQAVVALNGEELPHNEFSVLFANVTGQINPGVEPFVGERTRDSFYCAAYAVGAREMTLALPLLVRGWLWVDREISSWFERREPTSRPISDARYINRVASRLDITTDEPLYTVDGEILRSQSPKITVELGAKLLLAAGPGAGWRLAAETMSPV